MKGRPYIAEEKGQQGRSLINASCYARLACIAQRTISPGERPPNGGTGRMKRGRGGHGKGTLSGSCRNTFQAAEGEGCVSERLQGKATP